MQHTASTEKPGPMDARPGATHRWWGTAAGRPAARAARLRSNGRKASPGLHRPLPLHHPAPSTAPRAPHHPAHSMRIRGAGAGALHPTRCFHDTVMHGAKTATTGRPKHMRCTALRQQPHSRLRPAARTPEVCVDRHHHLPQVAVRHVANVLAACTRGQAASHCMRHTCCA